jgi:ribosomal protein L11
MAKKISALIKLALPAGKATPAPPVGAWVNTGKYWHFVKNTMRVLLIKLD